MLNPIEESNMQHLAKVVTRLGYTQVKSYDDVQDIMGKEMYDEIGFNKTTGVEERWLVSVLGGAGNVVTKK